MIQLKKARPRDAEILAEISERAFHSDIDCGAPGLGGPPGYNSAAWQSRMMQIGEYYKILVEDQIVGGFIILFKKARHYEVGRIFVDPDFQNQGIGTQAFESMWQEFPLAKKWTLGTPAWNRRTRHFYRKLGFVEVGEDGHGGILFERKVGRTVKDLFGKCGNNCGGCALYKDNLSDDRRQWCADGMGRYINWHPTPEKLRQCAGCQATDGFLYLKNCRVRRCAQYNGLENCAHCSAFACQDVPTVSVSVDYRDRVAERLGSPIAEEDYLAFIEPYEGMKHLEEIRASLGPEDIVEMKEVSTRPRLVDFPQDLPFPEEETAALEALHRLLAAVEIVDGVSYARRTVLRKRRRRLLKILWAFGRFGERAEEDGSHVVIESETYLAQKIDSNHARVQDYFEALRGYGVQCEHVPLVEEGWLTPKGALRKGGWFMRMCFADSAGGAGALKALQRYAARLDEEHGKRAFRTFSKVDMRVLSERQS